jgi:uncharacterized protein (TIGR02118 family)
MLRCTIVYPKQEGATFDFDYYLKKRIPLAKEILGGRFKVSKGLPSPDGKAPAFLCIATIDVASPADFAARNQKRGAELQGDVRNYTNIVPTIQMEEILT